MIFILVSRGNEDIRVFSSYSSVEQVMKNGARQHGNWCYAIGYDGIDELLPIYAYYITPNGDIVRQPIS